MKHITPAERSSSRWSRARWRTRGSDPSDLQRRSPTPAIVARVPACAAVPTVSTTNPAPIKRRAEHLHDSHLVLNRTRRVRPGPPASGVDESEKLARALKVALERGNAAEG